MTEGPPEKTETGFLYNPLDGTVQESQFLFGKTIGIQLYSGTNRSLHAVQNENSTNKNIISKLKLVCIKGLGG